MFLLVCGILLTITGAGVSIAFWVPKVLNRARLKEYLGDRYWMVYLVYSANGPVLLIAGILLVIKYLSLS
ncbi:MAG: hypothetical protein KKG47_01770 [Proteobacteria bacterium]|nr:hypothetical protein [Pseudomonadota bacterium]MBU1737304.1 hypothetical protein [Pseudomonadota bacterium]